MVDDTQNDAAPEAQTTEPGQQQAPDAHTATVSRKDRMKAWLAGYEHGLSHAAPRTKAELDDLKSILGIEDGDLD